MKVSSVIRGALVFVRNLFFMIVAVFILSTGTGAFAITLTGSNGRAVEFATIKNATPKGITAQMVADGPIIGIPWEKLDLKALENDQKTIYDAYLKTKEGESIELNIGPGMKEDEQKPGAEAPPQIEKYPGWIDVTVGDTVFMMQMPAGKPRGILIVSMGDFGNAFQFVSGHERGSGAWSEFQNKLDFALLTYVRPRAKTEDDPVVVDDFVYAQKGSGKSVYSAINALASKAKQPELANLPIALYGAQRTGAAFVYNFVQSQPERVLAAVVSKGAYYEAEPTEASAKVPMLFIWGEYCNNHELWNSEDMAATVLGKPIAGKANWTNGREPRGGGELNPVVDYFGKQYLLKTIEMRLQEEGAVAPPKADEPPADNADAGGAPPVDKPDVAKEKAGPPPLPELDRSKGAKGNLGTGEVLKITDPGAVLGPEETFLPNPEVGRLWKQFIAGELEAPLPKSPVL